MRPVYLLHTSPDKTALAAELADWIARLAHKAVAVRGHCDIALSGGSTPELLYRKLGELESFPWKETRFFLVDERFVKATHKDWNSGMIRRAFGRADLAYYPMDTDNPGTAREAARYYQEVLATAFGLPVPAEQATGTTAAGLPDPAGMPRAGTVPPSPSARQPDPARQTDIQPDSSLPLPDSSLTLPVFDLVLLGMGKDGHTASLFPGTGAVDVADRWVLSVTPLDAPHDRVSLSLPVLKAARNLVVLSTGADKGSVLSRVLTAPDPLLPVSLLLGNSPMPEFWIDQDLAAAIGRS